MSGLPQTADGSSSAFELVAIAASAGGLKAITQVLSNLPDDFPVPIVIVQHLDPRYPSQMAEILNRRTSIQVKQAEEGERLQPMTVYIAPPDRHLLITGDRTITLNQSELVHYLRPSADLLFQSIARSYGHRAIAIILTGTGRDGVSGAAAIKGEQGLVIAQNEATSDFFGMAGAAIESGYVDRVLPLNEIAPTLLSLIGKKPPT